MDKYKKTKYYKFDKDKGMESPINALQADDSCQRDLKEKIWPAYAIFI